MIRNDAVPGRIPLAGPAQIGFWESPFPRDGLRNQDTPPNGLDGSNSSANAYLVGGAAASWPLSIVYGANMPGGNISGGQIGVYTRLAVDRKIPPGTRHTKSFRWSLML